MNKRPPELTANDVLSNFPSSSLRPYQKEIISRAVEAFQTGKRCVILSAPTGFGKSYVNSAFTSVTHSFYTTPQLALIDQILSDPLLQSRFVEIKGRQNYHCHHKPHQTVNVGRCETEDYACKERFTVCPYWRQKKRALEAQSVLTSFAYLVAEGQMEGQPETNFGARDLLVVDEAHNIEEWCLNQISLRFAPYTIPEHIYRDFLPKLDRLKTETQLREFLRELKERLQDILGQYKMLAETTWLSIAQAKEMEKIEHYLMNYRRYISSKSEWTWQLQNDQLLTQPVFAREFMKELVWKRSKYYIISSATILDPQEHSELTGLRTILDEDEICFLEAPSTFPAQNRPVIDKSVGPLSKEAWENNKRNALRAIEEILRIEKGNVAIHCHSYHRQQWLAQNISKDLRSRLIVHTSTNRKERLDEWKHSRGKVFVSVAFNEGQDWKYDVCSAQILLKVPFPDLSDKRIERRLELGCRQWYNNQAMLETIQAYGRAIRAEDDKATFYVVDGSFRRLVRNCWSLMPKWFKEALPTSLIPVERSAGLFTSSPKQWKTPP